MKNLYPLLFLIPMLSVAQPTALQQNFQNPPNAAKPRVWWHWMNGNVTKEGITKDLEWMKRVGIGGFQNFDASLFTPNVTPKKLVFMTPDWKDAFKHTTDPAQVSGAWKVSFQESRGTPAQTTLNALASLSENTEADIKYFSGTATYDNNFTVPTVTKNASYLLDLGEVQNIAEVSVNGKSVGTVWKKPFRIDVTEALKAGSNTVQVKVTNLWVNRLIGDAQPAATNKITFTTMPFYQANSPLLPSGLLGPVQVLSAIPGKVAEK